MQHVQVSKTSEDEMETTVMIMSKTADSLVAAFSSANINLVFAEVTDSRASWSVVICAGRRRA